jgi:TPR repeat protein
MAMFGFDRRPKTEDLERRVSRLQAALNKCSEQARRWTEFRREVTGAIAVLMLALGFTLGVFASGASGDSDAAYAAYQDGHYATALRLAHPLAAEGNARAQSTLGLLYYHGNGVPQDPDEALKWFRRAADQDDAIAQFHLGVMFSNGEGVPQDNAEAANWFRRAADLGDAPAQYNLALFYVKGLAGEADNISAHMWFNLAAAHFPASDVEGRDAAIRNRDLVAKKMSAAEIGEAQKLAREWKQKSN